MEEQMQTVYAVISEDFQNGGITVVNKVFMSYEKALEYIEHNQKTDQNEGLTGIEYFIDHVILDDEEGVINNE